MIYGYILVRQGVGRLIRSETDTGLVSILDPRVTCKGYSDKVLYALEKYPVIDSIEEVESFFRDVKSEKYFM